LLLNLNANAHHDIPDELDLENPITITEKVIGVEWKILHTISLINADPSNADIKKLWTVLADTPSALLRRTQSRTLFSDVRRITCNMHIPRQQLHKLFRHWFEYH
jgi:hypothetical protein